MSHKRLDPTTVEGHERVFKALSRFQLNIGLVEGFRSHHISIYILISIKTILVLLQLLVHMIVLVVHNTPTMLLKRFLKQEYMILLT